MNGETVNSKSISPRIIFAGGGTGGHIYPALAMADAVKKFNPDSRIDFVGTPSGLESKLVPRAGYPLHFITVGRLHRSVGVFERIKTLIMMPLAMIKSFYLIFKLRPTAVVADRNFYTELTQMVRMRVFRQIAALNLHAHIVKKLGKPAHTHTTDSDEVNPRTSQSKIHYCSSLCL